MRHLVPVVAVAFLCWFAGSLHAQTVRNFIPGESGISPQGSKLWLAFEEFAIGNPMNITVDPLRDIEEVFFTISYPTYGSATQREEIVVTAKRLTAFNDPELDITVLVCHLDGDIHDTDEVETSFTLLEGWAVGDNEETGLVDAWTPGNDSTVDYPQAITSWDMVPHQIYPNSSHPGTFHVDLVVFHRYSFEHSEFGDFDILLWIDENAGEESQPPSSGAVLTATARPSYKVPERDDIHAGTYLVYRATFDPADFVDPTGLPVPIDGPAYVHFKITPSRGDAGSIRVSPGYEDENVWRPDLAVLGVQPNIETMKVFLNGGGTLQNDDPHYAVVDPTGSDDVNSDWYDNPADARNDPFRTIFRAVQAMPTDLANPVILLRDGAFWPGRDPEDSGGNGSDVEGVNWLTIRPDLDDGITRAQVEITDVAFIVSSSAPGNALFSITNASGDDIEVRWQDGTTEGLRIVGDGFDVRISRAGKTVAQMVTAINDHPDLGNDVSATGLDFTNFSVDVGDLYYDDVSEFVVFEVGTTEMLANSVVRTSQGTGEDEVHIFSELDVEEFTTADADDMLELKAAIEGHYTNMQVEVVHNVEMATLQAREFRIPAIFPNPDHNETWFEADMNDNGLRYPFVRYQDCTIRSVRLESNPPNDPENDIIPHHLWIDHSVLQNESKVSVDSREITGIPGDWTGGAWYTGCDFNTMRQTTNGPVMVRDAHFMEIGGDTGKQVSYAMNWFAENAGRVAGDLVHPDYFQWSPDDVENKNTHGNIIAVNLDFRDEDNHGQPFLLNVPGNDSITHKYTGIALVNLRMNSDRSQQLCGDVDHLLLWDSDVFQDVSGSRRVHFRGVPSTPQGNPHTSIHHNVSVRNSVVERMLVNAESEDQFVGDVPSLWSMIDSTFFTTQLRDEFEIDLSVDEIATIHNSMRGGAAANLVDFTTDWSPKTSGIGITLLVNRLTAEDIVYRMDASGTERLIDSTQTSGAVGAMEHPDNALGQPCEVDAFSVTSGSLVSAGADNNPLATLVLSDDRRMLILANTAFVAELAIDGISRVPAPATIDLVFEGKLSSGTATNAAKLALWNWTTSAWDDQDTFTIDATESVRTKTGITATSYAQADTGLIRSRLRLAPSSWPTATLTLHVDQMKIVVKE